MGQLLTASELQYYFEEANTCKNNGDFEKAEQHFYLVLSNAIKSNNFYLYVDASIQLLIIYINSGQYKLMQDIIHDVTPYIDQYASEELMKHFKLIKLLHLSIIGLGSPEEELQAIIEESKKSNDLFLLYNAVTNLMHIYNARNEFDLSLQLIIQNDYLLNPELINDYVAPFMYFVNKCEVYYHVGDFKKVEKMVRAMEQNALYKKVGQLEFHYWFGKAILADHYDDFELAKHFFVKALSLNTNKSTIKSELEIWISILEKRACYQEVSYYQNILIEGLKKRIEMLVSEERTHLIEQVTLSNILHKLHTDRLSEVRNRDFYEDELAKNLLYTNYTIAVLDVDEFKKINDQFGHVAGDQAIKFVATLIKNDIVLPDAEIIRYGGDEFVLLIPYELHTALPLLQDVHTNVCEKEFIIRETNQLIQLTISMGISATSEEPVSLLDLFRAADKALYRAKENGKNQIQISSIS